MAKKRVIAWGTGPIGLPGLRQLIGHPEYELVGLHAWSPAKIGQDAGDIAGTAKTGIIATDDVSALLALKADCLAYFGNYARHREAECVADVVPFLEAGTNVVTPALMDLIVPEFGRPEFVQPIVKACEKGQSSAFCGGTDPGYMGIGHLFGLLSGAGRIDSVSVKEICDLNGYGSYDAVATWGFNQPLDHKAAMFGEVGVGWHESTVRGIAAFLGAEIDEIVSTVENAAVDFDYDAAWGRGKAGTIAAVRWTVTGMYRGAPLVHYRKVERTHPDAAPDWEQPLYGGEAGYELVVDGDPSFTTATAISLYAGCAYTALHPINAINEVCAAKSGVLGQLDMPHFYSRAVRR